MKKISFRLKSYIVNDSCCGENLKKPQHQNDVPVASFTGTTGMLNDFRNPDNRPNILNVQRDEPVLIEGSGLTDDEDLKLLF